MRQQIHVISETLLEATDYLKQQVEQENFQQVVMITTSMMEGIEAILFISEQSEKDIQQDAKQLLYIFQELIQQIVNNEYSKIQTIIQFSLEPQIRKIYRGTEEEQSSTVLMGIYYDKTCPSKAYDDDRLQAMYQEAEKQNVEVIVFTSDGVDFEREKVQGKRWLDGRYVEVVTEFPDVIYNIFPAAFYSHSLTERRLRKKVPFTTHGFGNKLTLPRKLLRNPRTADLFIPFVGVTQMKKVNDFLEKNKKAVLKPISSARGENIYFIEKVGSRYKVYDHKEVFLVTYLTFKTWIEESIIPEAYILQRYVRAVTKKGEPYDFRAHMQKNREGKWHLTRLYPKVGSDKGILSNISTGGYTMDVQEFLAREFSQPETMYNRLVEKSFLIATEIDKNYQMSVDEMGIDLAIDETGHIWMHESNPGPQSKYHEEERAVHTIGYARYLAEKRIFFTNSVQEDTGFDNQFNQKTSRLEKVDWICDQPTIGMFTSRDLQEERLNKACAYVSAYEKSNFYVFEANDIDIKNRTIRGKIFENHAWVEKIVPFPDVIYDRLRMRNRPFYQVFYDTFDYLKIPMTHTAKAGSFDKSKLYDFLKKYSNLDEYLIPYFKPKCLKDVVEMMLKYKKIILKPKEGALTAGIIIIRWVENELWSWTEDREERVGSFQFILKKLENFDIENYVGQLFIESLTKEGNAFDLRFYTSKDLQTGKWSYMAGYPRIGNSRHMIDRQNQGGYRGKLEGFLQRNRPNFLLTKKEKLKDFLVTVSTIYEKETKERYVELGFDIIIDSDNNFYLVEVNSNRPGTTDTEQELAVAAIRNCVYLAENK